MKLHGFRKRARQEWSAKSAAKRLNSMEMACSIGRDTRSPLATRLTYEGSTLSLRAIRLNSPRHMACALVPFIRFLLLFSFILLLLLTSAWSRYCAESLT